jgi:hypothetical protein
MCCGQPATAVPIGRIPVPATTGVDDLLLPAGERDASYAVAEKDDGAGEPGGAGKARAMLQKGRTFFRVERFGMAGRSGIAEAKPAKRGPYKKRANWSKRHVSTDPSPGQPLPRTIA